MLNGRRSLSAAIAALLGLSAMQSIPATPAGRGQRGLKNIVGPATNWPSGKVHKRRSHYPDGQHAKLPKARKHKQHVHPLRDDNGAYTLTGFHGALPEIVGYDGAGECIVEMRSVSRRMWLAGISAQRGY